ncbi:MAG: hypothetical protein AAFZ63_25495 [Bacteroidota bacterium]
MDRTAPDSSAILDISSTEKGVLIPRMTTIERDAIVEPADALLVYDTDQGSFWYYENNRWNEIGTRPRITNSGIGILPAPELVSLLDIGGLNLDMARQGNVLYLIDDNNDQLRAVDMTDPTNPQTIGTLDIVPDSDDYLIDIAIKDNSAYIAYDDYNSFTEGGIVLVDITDPAAMTQSVVNPDGYYTSCVVAGEILYGFDAKAEAFKLFDISNPASPQLLSTISNLDSRP